MGWSGVQYALKGAPDCIQIACRLHTDCIQLRMYESHVFELRIKTWMKVILAVMSTTWAVVKIRPEKNSGLYGIWTHDLCDTGAGPSALVSQRSWVQIPYRPEFFSGLIFTTAQVVHITARITFIQIAYRLLGDRRFSELWKELPISNSWRDARGVQHALKRSSWLHTDC